MNAGVAKGTEEMWDIDKELRQCLTGRFLQQMGAKKALSMDAQAAVVSTPESFSQVTTESDRMCVQCSGLYRVICVSVCECGTSVCSCLYVP